MLIAIDFETHLISNEHPWPKPVCLSYKDDSGLDLLVGYDDMDNFLGVILNSNHKIIAHNATFETGVIYTHFSQYKEQLFRKLAEGEIICTKIYQELIDHTVKKPLYKYSLADLVQFYFEVDISAEKKDPNAWRLRYSELDGVPKSEWPREAVSYALDDSEWALKVYRKQMTENLLYGESVRSEALLNLMGKYGLEVDMDRVNTLEKELHTHIDPKYDLLIERGFAAKVKGKYTKSMKKFREHLEENVPKELLKFTPKGTISTKAEDLVHYGDDEIVQAILDIMVYEKILTAFVVNLKKADPVIRTRYSATKSTGRTSSSMDRTMPSVNIQQMPREVPNVTYDIRNCFKPREGYKICSIDYSGLELASTAHQLYTVYGHSKMRDKINYGDTPTDMHSMLAYQIRTMDKKPCTYEEFVQNKKNKDWKEYRQLAKPINLGFPGGIGYDTMRSLLAKEGINTKFKIIEKAEKEWLLKNKAFILRQEFDNVRLARMGKFEYAIVVDELVKLKKALFTLYPELQDFLTRRHNRYTTGQTKRIKNDYGEWETEPMYAYDIYGMKRDWCTYTAFCNGFLMQTPSAIGAKRMMCKIIEKYDNDPRMNPLAFIHDEIVFEVLTGDDMYDIIEDVSTIMIDQMQTVLSSVRIAVEADLMDHWAKAGDQWSKQYWKDPDDKELKHG